MPTPPQVIFEASWKKIEEKYKEVRCRWAYLSTKQAAAVPGMHLSVLQHLLLAAANTRVPGCLADTTSIRCR